MDAKRFVHLTRSIAPASRRGFIRALTALGFAGGAVASHEDNEAAAKTKKKCNKKYYPCKVCKNGKGKFKPRPDGTPCKETGVCQAGECTCSTECCWDLDCVAPQVCQPDGTCAIPA